MNNLQSELFDLLNISICDSEITYNSFLARLEEGDLTEAENPTSHFVAYFFPYNPKTKQVFIVHHKDAGLWVSPGGHIDKGEDLLMSLNREINEELGINNFFTKEPSPFLLTISPVKNKNYECKEHFDIWYLMETDGADFKIDQSEFHETKWVTIDEALSIVSDPPNRRALEYLKDRN